VESTAIASEPGSLKSIATRWRRISSSRKSRLDRPSPLWLLPSVLAGIYATSFAIHLPRSISEITWSSDVASAYTIPETVVSSGTGGHTVLSASGQWLSLWFGLITARLPLHRVLWEAAPTLVFIITGVAVAWSVLQIAGRRAAVLAVLLGLIPSARALGIFMAAFDHNVVPPSTALIGLYLIWLARTGGRRSAVPLVVGMVIGVCLASDVLVAGASMIPMGLIALLLLWRREPSARRMAYSIAATLLFALPIAALTNVVMYASGYRIFPAPASVASLSELPLRTKLMYQGLGNLFNGYLVDGRHVELGVACAVLMAVVLPLLLVTGVRTIVRFVTPPRDSGVSKPGSSISQPEIESARLAHSVHVIFWTVSAIALCGMVWLTASYIHGPRERYYGTIVYSVAATLPLLRLKSMFTSLVAPIGVATFFLGSLAGLQDRDFVAAPLVDASKIVAIAEAEHATVGYAEYGAASNLTWNTNQRIMSRPIVKCPHREVTPICRYPLVYVPEWFAPRRRRTFLLLDRAAGWTRAPDALGQPIATYALGSLLMLVYSYDIASRIGEAPSS
jgi:hypothetical protein